jgi:hypothetical protein
VNLRSDDAHTTSGVGAELRTSGPRSASRILLEVSFSWPAQKLLHPGAHREDAVATHGRGSRASSPFWAPPQVIEPLTTGGGTHGRVYFPMGR